MEKQRLIFIACAISEINMGIVEQFANMEVVLIITASILVIDKGWNKQ